MKSLIAAGHVNTNGEFAVITQIMRLYMYIEPVWHVYFLDPHFHWDRKTLGGGGGGGGYEQVHAHERTFFVHSKFSVS